MARRLWDKGEELNASIHHFTVDTDPQVDLELVHWDAIGSAAQARMLASLDVLTKEEVKKLLSALKKISDQGIAGEFVIPSELEDCHTAIENILIETTGEAGEKIHTGRSRNDQVITALRLYSRDCLLKILSSLLEFASSIAKRIDIDGKVAVPGYTHYQRAMPSSVGMWLHSFYEWSLDLSKEGLFLLDLLNKNPLGASSGFGSSLKLDRDLTASLLGFDAVQRNPVHVQNSRGRYELKLLRFIGDIASMIEKLACDLVLFNTEEFGFVRLPTAFTSGSSIMPQKRNPDVLELLRATASRVRACEFELQGIISKLPSNYHRDYQFTKEPLVRAVGYASSILPISAQVIGAFELDKKRLDAAMGVEVYATYEAYRLVKSGMSFRQAYREAAKRYQDGELDKNDLAKDFEVIQTVLSKEIKEARSEFMALEKSLSDKTARFSRIEVDIFKL
jgi:argininosuccinate lyase